MNEFIDYKNWCKANGLKPSDSDALRFYCQKIGGNKNEK